jgi:epsilon-lactone hydrolase
MASKQSEAVSKLYQSWLTIPAQHPDWSLEDQRELIEGWNVLTTEPGGVDYLEINAGGRPALWAVPHGSTEDRVLFCIHGGGFIAGSIYTHRKLFAHLAKAVGARALIVSYRLLPEGVHPAPIDDTLAAYRWLLDQGIHPNHIAFAGDSAGGGLAITTQLRACDQGLPLPAAATLFSPWVDMEGTGETMVSNSTKDALFNLPWIKELAMNFLGGSSPRDSHANPLYADLTGLGPLYIQVGEHELLLDDSRRLAEHAGKAGVDVRLDVFPEMQHTFQMMAGRAPEADDAIRRLAEWVRPKLGLADHVRAA